MWPEGASRRSSHQGHLLMCNPAEDDMERRLRWIAWAPWPLRYAGPYRSP